MLGVLARRLFGSANDRQVKSMRKTVDQINALESSIAALDDSGLRAKTDEIKGRLAAGESLDDLAVEAFAVVREAAKRTLKQRHFDVQLIGGMVLHKGGIAEMKTGEGKTLVATLATYLNALEGKGVHVVTVNDYLARRDAGWMGAVYGLLGMQVGVIVPGLDDAQRKQAYACDITYGTNNEFGFDYLRDNMRHGLEAMVQRAHHFAIVDEVDSILVDEARTPLIISGPSDDSSELYRAMDRLVIQLVPGDWEKDEKQRSVSLTEQGQEHLQALLAEAGLLKAPDLYDIENVSLVHHAQQGLRAHKVFSRDVDYIVKDRKVIIIDEFTGRMMDGRRYSDGLHQALEAKEAVPIQAENQTLASITFQNYFRLYHKLAGMTGTAATEAAEFAEIYRLGVIEIPTHRAMIRKDEDDEVYRTAREKNEAIVEEIQAAHKKSQPVLVGTVSIEKSEHLSELLKAKGLRHQVLNARYHEQEAYIIAQAGRVGAVTIATNMAGRGTDIQLGGNAQMRIAQELPPEEQEGAKAEAIRAEVEAERQQVLAAGGLFIIGTERHESRRIDNQLRGRTGRQGDPGHSKFFLSCEDDLLRIFAGERLDTIMRTFGVQEGEAITHKWLNSAIATAQKRVEQRNYEIRKNLLKYDDVVNDQRKAVFEQRQEFMESADLSEIVAEMRADVVEDLVARHLPPKAYAEQWDIEGLEERVSNLLGLDLPLKEWAAEDGIANEEMQERIQKAADARAAERETLLSAEQTRHLEKNFLLQMIDLQWREHLMHLDHLRNVIGLRGYGQRDPLNEYKTEAFSLFEKLLVDLRQNLTRWLLTVQIEMAPPEPQSPQFTEIHIDPLTGENAAQAGALPDGLSPEQRQALPVSSLPENWEQTSRNAACPCGSGKKFKHCHGALV